MERGEGMGERGGEEERERADGAWGKGSVRGGWGRESWWSVWREEGGEPEGKGGRGERAGK